MAGKKSEKLVGDSTRLHGSEASLAASLARPGEKRGERESERVPKQRMTMKPLGGWEGGRENSAKQRVRRVSPCKWRRGRVSRLAGRWPIPNEKVLRQSLVRRQVGGQVVISRDRLSRAQRVM